VSRQLEYRDPHAPRDVDQTNYGKFARLDPVISKFPPLVELKRDRVTLAFLKHHRYQVLLDRSEQEMSVLTHQKKTVNSSHDALNEAGHCYGNLFIESLVMYPKLVLETFIPGPLQERREHQQPNTYTNSFRACVSQERVGERVCSPVTLSVHSDVPF
jgi:hypothetical protein